jgi:hypothetical protein
MAELRDGDRVITVQDVPPIARGTLGTVVDASGISLIVRFDGDSSPGRLTPRNAVRKVGGNAVLAAAAAAGAVAAAGAATMAMVASKRRSAKKAPAKQPIAFGGAKIARAAGPTAAKTSITTEILGQVVILFDDAFVDLQTSGPLAGAWAGTIVFKLGQEVTQDTKLTLDVRGHILKSAASTAGALVIVDGEPHSKNYPLKRVLDTDTTWRITQTLRKGATMHTLALFLAAERRTTSDTVRIAIDSIDVVAR